jgi:hypothetical protein
LTVGAVWLFATGVGLELANNPTLGCGGATTAFGCAAGKLGIVGVFNFTTSGFGGSGTGLGVSILRGVSTIGAGGTVAFTCGTGGSFGGGGGSVGKISWVLS